MQGRWCDIVLYASLRRGGSIYLIGGAREIIGIRQFWDLTDRPIDSLGIVGIYLELMTAAAR